MADGNEHSKPDAPGDDPSRRTFLISGIAVLGAGVTAIAGLPALPYIGFPLFTPTTTGSDDYLPVGSDAQFVDGSAPVKVDMYSDKVDAWNRVEQVKVGSAWVVKQGGAVTAFSTVCPHLGCAIDYDPESNSFKCPCHRSAFGLDGTVQAGPSPRPMDTLEVEAKEQLVAIRFQRFKQGVADKEPV